VARDVGASRTTVQGYFEILVDTQLGWFLPAFRGRAKVKEVAHPKFFLFDVGVRRGLSAELRNQPTTAELGRLFESWLLGEIRLIGAARGIGAELAYWRTESGTEVDLVWHRGSRRIGFEIKYMDSWASRDSAGLRTLLAEKKVSNAYGIFRGPHRLVVEGITVLPWADALAAIASGEIGFD
jgi:predicted AAA+ superfamily ATPase